MLCVCAVPSTLRAGQAQDPVDSQLASQPVSQLDSHCERCCGAVLYHATVNISTLLKSLLGCPFIFLHSWLLMEM